MIPTWCQREWDAGLGFLAETYGFSVKPFDNRPSMPARSYCSDYDFYYGPTCHALSFKARVLWLAAGTRDHCEWLHEVAHLVVAPPWERSPTESEEFGGIFAWERAVGKELTRTGRWGQFDFDRFLAVQEAYGVGDTIWGDDLEWGELSKQGRATILKYCNKTLRLAGLVNGLNRPMWGSAPNWTDEVRERWGNMVNFRCNWSTIKAG